MIKIEGDLDFIEVETLTEYDASTMGNILKVKVKGNWRLEEMRDDIANLKARLDTVLKEQEQELELRKNNPALKDVYDQYQVVYKLVKKADDAEKEINSV